MAYMQKSPVSIFPCEIKRKRENNSLREIIHKEAKPNNCVSQPNVIEL